MINDRVIFQKSVFRFFYSYSLFLAIFFRVIDAWSSEFLTIDLLSYVQHYHGSSSSSVFWLILEVILNIHHIKNSITDSSSSTTLGLSDKEIILGQYYMTSFEDLYDKKCRRWLYSDYYSVNLKVLPAVIHILISVIPVPVLFVDAIFVRWMECNTLIIFF